MKSDWIESIRTLSGKRTITSNETGLVTSCGYQTNTRFTVKHMYIAMNTVKHIADSGTADIQSPNSYVSQSDHSYDDDDDDDDDRVAHPQ